MLILILVLPLLSAFCGGFFGFLVGRAGSFILSNLFILISFLLGLLISYYTIFCGEIYYINLGSWFDSGSLAVTWSFMFDQVACCMAVFVLLVSLLVHFYSCGYMFFDPHSIRFISYLSLFTFFMLVLVTADNFIVFFVGWEGVGLSSFLLISFWTTRQQAVKAAMKALIINRIGDFWLLFSIVLIFLVFGSVDFLTVFFLIPFYSQITFYIFGYTCYLLDILSFFLFLAAVGKSAQLGLHTWLPDAMEGPTPVSALIHAATMVTAGIFLIIRCSVIFEFSQFTLAIMTVWGLITIIVSGLIANFQTDLKKIIAYSTCSQLGYMVVACGMSDYLLALFHLVNHACFKALLFLCAGALIHNFLNEQDLRKLSFSHEISPLLSTCFDIGALCLSAIPFYGGFYTKDLIIESGSIVNFSFNSLGYYFGLLGALLTFGYSSLITEVNNEEEIYVYKKFYLIKEDLSLFFAVPLIILSFASLFVGFYLKFFFDNSMDIFFENIFIFPKKAVLIYSRDYLPYYIQLIPLFLGLFLMFCYSSELRKNFLFSKQEIKKQVLKNNNIRDFSFFYLSENLLINKFYFDDFYFYFIVNKFFSFSLFIFEFIDKGLLEILGPKGIIFFLKKFNLYWKQYYIDQDIIITQYFFVFFFYCVIVLIFLV